MDLLQTFNEKNLSNWFVNDYFSCRSKIFKYAQEFDNPSKSIETWALPIDSELTTDAFWFGPENAKNVTVLISGTHGIEGFCGSAIQSFILDCLQRQQLELQADSALLIVHGLNPWGMKHARRCDQDGIDLNRNFVDFTEIRQPSEEYLTLIGILQLPDVHKRQHKLSLLEKQWGRTAYEKTISGGQYSHAWAPFYGGDKPAFSSQVIDEIIQRWQLESKTLTVIDLHTGLGPWGFGELISDHEIHSNGNQFAHAIFGSAVAATQTGESFSVSKDGLLDYRWHKLMENNGCFLTLEFGTYCIDQLFDVILNDHLFWLHHTNPTLAQIEQQRAAMLNHFYPQDSLWQQAVLFKAWQVVLRALQVGTQ